MEIYATTIKGYRGLGEVTTIEESDTTLGGEVAKEVTISYEVVRNHRDLEAEATRTKMSWIICQKGDYFFDIRYTASETDHDTYLEVYSQAKESFGF